MAAFLCPSISAGFHTLPSITMALSKEQRKRASSSEQGSCLLPNPLPPELLHNRHGGIRISEFYSLQPDLTISHCVLFLAINMVRPCSNIHKTHNSKGISHEIGLCHTQIIEFLVNKCKAWMKPEAIASCCHLPYACLPTAITRCSGERVDRYQTRCTLTVVLSNTTSASCKEHGMQFAHTCQAGLQ